MLWKEVLHLHIWTCNMSHTGTSATGMLGLHMLCIKNEDATAETRKIHSLWLWSTGFATLVARQPERGSSEALASFTEGGMWWAGK